MLPEGARLDGEVMLASTAAPLPMRRPRVVRCDDAALGANLLGQTAPAVVDEEHVGQRLGLFTVEDIGHVFIAQGARNGGVEEVRGHV